MILKVSHSGICAVGRSSVVQQAPFLPPCLWPFPSDTVSESVKDSSVDK